MAEIEFHIQIEGVESDEQLLDPDEIDMLLDSTRAQIREHIQKRLGGFACEEHGQPPKVIVSGTYSLETEQLEYSYRIEACCNRMTMQTAALLSRV
jgi:hypothetical protein